MTTPLPAVLRQLADGVVSGCLHVDDGVGGEAKVYLRGGHVYAVQVPGRRPQLGARLVSSGALGPEALAEALEAQRTELQGWRLGELLVHLGYVDQPVVEAFIDEQLREQTTDLMRWPTGTWKFRVNERTREDVAPPTPVETLLAAVEERRQQWDVITEVLHGPDAVPMLSAAGQTDAEMAIDPEAWSLLCKVDGVRSVSDLAKECGFTLFEAGQVVYSLVRTGLLEVEETIAPEAPAEPTPVADVASKLAAAFAPAEVVVPAQAESTDLEMSPADVANLVASALRQDRAREDRSLEGPPPAPEDDVDASVDRVSQALSAMLGDELVATDELFAAPKARARNPKPPKPKTAAEMERERKQSARAEAHKKRRAADAEELAKAQADLEAARAAEAAAAAAKLAADHEAEIVSLAAARQASEERAAAEAAAEAARLEAERVAAEEAEAARIAAEAAAAEERARVEAELREAAEQEAAAEAARLEAERIAAEEAAAAEAARLEAERIAAEEAEAERIAAEAAAAEERARVEAELREAAEKEAAEEAARLAAEEEARQAAEAEESARLLAHAEERAKAEEELRLAAEAEAAETARLEAERVAAEELAAAEAARLEEQERAAAEAAEQARTSEQRLHAADAFAELSATAATAGDTLVVDAPVATEQDELDDDLDDDLDPTPSYPPADTDMASLFRELSSLGLDDEPAPAAPAPRSAPKPPSSAAAGKPKKKGLFGR